MRKANGGSCAVVVWSFIKVCLKQITVFWCERTFSVVEEHYIGDEENNGTQVGLTGCMTIGHWLQILE